MKIETENHVKELVKQWFQRRRAWHVAVVQNGLGVHGIHDRVGAVPLTVTPAMVGMTFGLLVSVEAKKPGRRGEPRRGMSAHQQQHLDAINKAGGVSICCDGLEDLAYLDSVIECIQKGEAYLQPTV